MKSAFGIQHVISKEVGFAPMGPRKKASPAEIKALKAGYRMRTARNAGKLVKLGAKVR